MFVTAGFFATDAITVGDRLTINAGLRFDHSRAISQDLPAVDLQGRETDTIVEGLGTLFVWNVISPRMGVTAKLDTSGKTMLRASYGRFIQGVLTGEIGAFHPGATTTTTMGYVNGGYSVVRSIVDRNSLQLNPRIRAPRTDEYAIGIDREVGRRLQVATAYVRKSGANFIGWEDTGGVYELKPRRLFDGREIMVYERQNAATDQRFLLTNPDGYSMTYNGLVLAVEKRRSQGWQAFGSYTLSRVTGLQAGSASTAAGAQVSTVSPPPGPAGLTFGRDPNDLTNARGRLPNDRPHVFRVMGSADLPKTGFTMSANLQYFTGKPWAASALVSVPQNQNLRVLLEPRGSRRLSSQTILDLRLSKSIPAGSVGRLDVMLDVLNALNETAEENIVTDAQMTTLALNPNFGLANAFVDPRRVMLGVRLNLGR
jgi:hypothetical protein